MTGRRTPSRRRRRAALAVLLAGVTPLAVAQAALSPDVGLVASLEHTGVVDLGFFGPPGAPVAFTETVAGTPRPLAKTVAGANGFSALPAAVTWRCDRLSRRFGASTTTADGTVKDAVFEIRTPSCAGRLAVAVPRHVGRRATAAVRIVDRWRLGDRRVRLCVSGAGVRHHSRLVRLTGTGDGVVRRVRVRRSGSLRVAVSLDGHRTLQRVGVGTAAPVSSATGAVLLATGDSTIEGIDSYVGERLGTAARTTSASRPGTGLSKAGDVSWAQAAARQVDRLRPRVTIISLGANEGFPMQTADGTTVACCDDTWVAQFAARARVLMRTYTRSDGHLLWLDLPRPRDERRAAIIEKVNLAVRQAAVGQPDVEVLDLAALISPGGRYTETLRRGGKDVRVRADDGLHLSNAGASIAADAVVKALRASAWLDEPATRRSR
jgi:lysophospholipase L1-like esterase